MAQSGITKAAILCVRLALAASFLSAVAVLVGGMKQDRGEVTRGGFSPFATDTGTLFWFLPKSAVAVFAWGATVLESVLAIGLICRGGAKFYV